jgi:hypothetical protein
MKPTTVRRYPRDVTAGTRVLIRLITDGRGSRMVPGTITELTQDGGRYRVIVETDRHGRVRLYPAANAKLDTIR